MFVSHVLNLVYVFKVTFVHLYIYSCLFGSLSWDPGKPAALCFHLLEGRWTGW